MNKKRISNLIIIHLIWLDQIKLIGIFLCVNEAEKVIVFTEKKTFKKYNLWDNQEMEWDFTVIFHPILNLKYTRILLKLKNAKSYDEL